MKKLNKIYGLRMEYPKKLNSYFLPLTEYIVFAKQSISRFIPNLANRILKDDDFIADLTHDIIMADWRWNGKGDRVGYRCKCAEWSIMDQLKKRKKHICSISLDEEISVYSRYGKNAVKTKRIKDILEDKKIKDNEVTEDLLKPFSLTATQKEYLLRNINGENPIDIARDKNVTPQHVSLVLKQTKERIRKFYDKKFTL